MKKTSDINAELKEIKSAPIMEYTNMIDELSSFAEQYKSDERSAVKKAVESAIAYRDKMTGEIERIHKMMLHENIAYEKYGDDIHICGVDEVGRGPFAGPIVTAAVILPKDFVIPYLNDSKKVNEKLREELYDIITSTAISVSIGLKTAKEIDEMGIAVADDVAMRDAVNGLKVRADYVLVDAFEIHDLEQPQTAMIKGDAKSVSIAAASIVAKVTRDRMMVEYSKKYPEYEFEKNVGYGVPNHIEALRKYGPCEIHRRSFIKKYINDNQG